MSDDLQARIDDLEAEVARMSDRLSELDVLSELAQCILAALVEITDAVSAKGVNLSEDVADALARIDQLAHLLIA